MTGLTIFRAPLGLRGPISGQKFAKSRVLKHFAGTGNPIYMRSLGLDGNTIHLGTDDLSLVTQGLTGLRLGLSSAAKLGTAHRSLQLTTLLGIQRFAPSIRLAPNGVFFDDRTNRQPERQRREPSTPKLLTLQPSAPAIRPLSLNEMLAFCALLIGAIRDIEVKSYQTENAALRQQILSIYGYLSLVKNNAESIVRESAYFLAPGQERLGFLTGLIDRGLDILRRLLTHLLKIIYPLELSLETGTIESISDTINRIGSAADKDRHHHINSSTDHSTQ